MSDGHGFNPDTPPGWASNQPPPYGGQGPEPWATPGSGGTPPKSPGNPYGGAPGPYDRQPGGAGPHGQQPYGGAPGSYGQQPYGGAPGPYGYGAPAYGAPPALKPGIIPLRPLALGDIYNGAVQFIRSNPRATLGLSAAVTAVSAIIGLLVQLPTLGMLADAAADPTAFTRDPSQLFGAFTTFFLGTLVGAVLQMIAIIVLSGMLTSVLGRSVFGEPVSVGQAWRLTAGRILPLLGLALLQVLMVFGLMIALVAVATVLISVIIAAEAPVALAVVVGLVLGLGSIAGAIFLYTKLSLAGPVIVLERAGAFTAIGRSFRLVKGDFWRVFGILLLTAIIAGLVGGAVSVPFSLTSGLISPTDQDFETALTVSLILSSLGAIVSGTITNPFSAAVTALLYTDRRMRAEAFDLVLQTAATDRQRGVHGPAAEDLWHPSHAAGAQPYGYGYGYGQPPQGPQGPHGYGHPPQDPGAWPR
ncbi:glycerophosphoryl diester phosphodiesterase membrane domain-containing protein [Planomonospora venezuelensis]|uniref:DUF7847 domain-containing protein n=1 Tax=Planomonospora venezuelensis TaxID=1999 RepID=A0A841CZ81_PLAVE|nr:glycerophosphoryl diester phosphodiesterase membrane domain-containing protein [Planomonospora venezuelensis]MBB5962103.1 hypothetical protein [Planomonospora venezuelensis]GIN00204.1 hypothetical protein Pve01_18620 [Planomonospora venezuelensis]